MNEKDTLKILGTIAASYPSVERLNETAITGMAKVWARMFADDDARMVGNAVAAHIATCKFPPSVAEIRERLVQMKHPELITPEDAWSIAQEAAYAGTEFGAATVWSSIPSLVQQAIGQMGWSSLFRANCKDPRKAFLDAYRPIYERKRDELLLPAFVRNSIEASRQASAKQIAAGLDEIHRIADEKRTVIRQLMGDPLQQQLIPETTEGE